MLIFTIGCKTPQRSVSDQKASPTVAAKLQVTLLAHDLSEDGTEISTNQDEIALLIYEKKGDEVLEAPIMAELVVVKDIDMSIVCTSEYDASEDKNESRKYLLFLIELDSDRSMKQIDPVVRVHYQKLLELNGHKDIRALEDILGDNDLLGVLEFEKADQPKQFEVSGMQFFDRFKYVISVKF